MACVDLSRQQHYAIIDQEVEIGLRSIAVPIFDQRSNVVAALNTGMAAIPEPAEGLIETILPKLLMVQAGLRRIL
jgi:IclR family pca regulon transcriptional regulator